MMSDGANEVLASAGDEESFFFSSDGEDLVGIVTRPFPGHSPADASVALVPGGWLGLSSGRNRTLVRLARRLAGDGLQALRFEYRGVGDSTGSITRFELARPFVADLRAALQRSGLSSPRPLFLVGFCFGARTALPLAGELPNVRGLVLVAAPVHDGGVRARWERTLAQRATARRLGSLFLRPTLIRDAFRPERRRFLRTYIGAKLTTLRRRLLSSRSRASEGEVVSPAFIEQLKTALELDIPVLFVFGTTDAAYREFAEALETTTLGALVKNGSLVDVIEIEGDVHGLGRVRVQEDVIDVIAKWVGRRARSSSKPVPSGGPIARRR